MKALLTALLIGLIVSPLAADDKTHPKTILVIRHAEKPDAGPDLNEKGKKRADAILKLFDKSRPDPFPTPDFIFASADSGKSDRPAETIAPLAAALKLTPDEEFKNKTPKKLAEELNKQKYDGKTVLICWHHGEIPDLLHELGIDAQLKKIDKNVFDRVWVVTYDEKGKAKMTVKPQVLLPDDPKE